MISTGTSNLSFLLLLIYLIVQAAKRKGIEFSATTFHNFNAFLEVAMWTQVISWMHGSINIDASLSLCNKVIGKKNLQLLNADMLIDADMTSFFPRWFLLAHDLVFPAKSIKKNWKYSDFIYVIYWCIL